MIKSREDFEDFERHDEDNSKRINICMRLCHEMLQSVNTMTANEMHDRMTSALARGGYSFDRETVKGLFAIMQVMGYIDGDEHGQFKMKPREQ